MIWRCLKLEDQYAKKRDQLVKPVSKYSVSKLFLSEEDLYRTSEEIEMRTKLVLKEAAVRLADVLRKITEECKRW